MLIAHIFRRDLRLDDNTSLLTALSEGKVLPVFIIDPRQADDHPYRSAKAADFLKNSLFELDQGLKKNGGRLYVFSGKAEEVVENIISQHVDKIYFNEDYTPFSKERDEKIKSVCEKKEIECKSFSDALLTKPGEILTAEGTPYKVFTSFYHKASSFHILQPKKFAKGQFFTEKIKEESFNQIKDIFSEPAILKGGILEGEILLKNLSEQNHYDQNRDRLSYATSRLSAHLKFGTISVRQAYWRAAELFGQNCTFIKELFWRDFFTHIAHFFPQVFGQEFNNKYRGMTWDQDEEIFTAWCEGRTGFPVVDAAMKELVQTGLMHNRARMITASFLIKDLHIDWRWGERFFAQHLVDYDPAVNNGNWQWAASTGCDAQPYFRIFNPWRQQERFDPDAEYIKKWLSELESLDAKTIHKLEKFSVEGYPKPIVDHKLESQKSKAHFSTYSS